MVYAVVRTGGKQQRVSVGDRFEVEKIPIEKGEKVELDQVLAVGEGENLQVGSPVVEGAKVVCEVVEQGRGRKILVGKYKRRKGYYRKKGHRQSFTRLRVESILAEGIEVSAAMEPVEETVPDEETAPVEAVDVAEEEIEETETGAIEAQETETEEPAAED